MFPSRGSFRRALTKGFANSLQKKPAPALAPEEEPAEKNEGCLIAAVGLVVLFVVIPVAISLALSLLNKLQAVLRWFLQFWQA